jgi:hypothetical protein
MVFVVSMVGSNAGADEKLAVFVSIPPWKYAVQQIGEGPGGASAARRRLPGSRV